jgi:Fur family ferric uptake transcriptional regulator
MEKNKQILVLTEAIVNKGNRLTNARMTIIECLVASGGHISADELAERVWCVQPKIGRMTVYRTMELLSELGVVRPIYQGTGAAHYILMAGGSHHHLICNQCGLFIEFDHCQSNEMSRLLSERYGFQINSHLLEFHGLCADCCQS